MTDNFNSNRIIHMPVHPEAQILGDRLIKLGLKLKDKNSTIEDIDQAANEAGIQTSITMEFKKQ